MKSTITAAGQSPLATSPSRRSAPHLLPLTAALLGLLTSLVTGFYAGVKGDDARDYALLAHNVVAGHGLSLCSGAPYTPSAKRSPVYPLFLASVYATLGDSRGAVLLVQSIMMAIACGLLTATAQSLLGGKVAVVAALLVSLNPYFGRWAGAVLTEALYLPLVIATIWAFTRAVLSSKWSWFGISGVVWGLSTLCRPLSIALLPFLVGANYLFVPPVRRRSLNALVLLLLGMATLAPWTIRNWVRIGGFIPLQTSGSGANIWLTTLAPEDQPTTDWNDAPKCWPAKYPEIRACNAAGASAIAQREAEKGLMAAAVGRMMAHPGSYLLSRITSVPRLWIHSGRLWYTDTSFRAAWNARQYAVLLIKAGLLLLFSLGPVTLAALGIWRLRRGWRHLTPLLIFSLMILVVHLPLWVEERYGMPAVPFLLVFAAAALVRSSAPYNIDGC